MQKDLIYDIGMHHALDTEFYLKKGFRVVAIEANPDFVENARKKYSKYINEKRLFLVNAALWEGDEKEISFYVNTEKDDWSSVEKWRAEREGHTCKEIKVSTIKLGDLFNTYGVPYYIKCDIEGGDIVFTWQLLQQKERPPFVSVEAMSIEILSILRACGYDTFQIVNMARNHMIRPPNPPREGEYVDTTFNGHMSGLFGRELPPEKWKSMEEILDIYMTFRRLRALDPDMAFGWCDFHATRKEYVK